ncbi:MAG TPA: tetratricopeptide repeat protein [Gammaproteobacteria bacterium]|nr:tetratricopeptide repeat protein [Gammaproteobacteria bacterium]
MRAEDIALLAALVVAATGAAGILWAWLRERHRRPPGQRFTPEYFRALSLLLDNQMDRALEVFMELADRDEDTVEFHFALGSLFRRKGELERATLIHQNLIARESLSREQRDLALKELGQDYLRAGLYDRAERIFLQLLDLKAHQEFAARQLIMIYEQQQDWAQAAALRRRLERITGSDEAQVVAQYCCEMAESAAARGDRAAAVEALAEARRYARELPRVRLLTARAAVERGEPREAVHEYQQLLEGDPGLAELAMPPLAAIFPNGARARDFDSSVSRALASAEQARTPIAAVGFKYVHLRSPAVIRAIEGELTQLISPYSDHEIAPLMDSHEARATLIPLLSGWVGQRSLYQCRVCGFRAHELYWHCPGCRGWDTMRMRQDVFPLPGIEPTR